MRYDCATPSVAHWIDHLAKKTGLTDHEFTTDVQSTAQQIAALPAALDDPPTRRPADPPTTDETMPTEEPERGPRAAQQTAPVETPPPSEPERIAAPDPPPAPQPETAAAAAEREREYRELLGFGIGEPTPRRRWRR